MVGARNNAQSHLKKLTRVFFGRGAELVAQDLLGAILVRRVRGILRQARIIETEAYVGSHDLACHASKGLTARTQVMFGPPGHAYVYLIYGMYHMLNIVTAPQGDPQAVLLRAAMPLRGWRADLAGPGKLARAFHITMKDRGLDLTGPDLYLLKNFRHHPPVVTTPRIGIDYAGAWRLAPLRFLIGSSHEQA